MPRAPCEHEVWRGEETALGRPGIASGLQQSLHMRTVPAAACLGVPGVASVHYLSLQVPCTPWFPWPLRLVSSPHGFCQRCQGPLALLWTGDSSSDMEIIGTVCFLTLRDHCLLSLGKTVILDILSVPPGSFRWEANTVPATLSWPLNLLILQVRNIIPSTL